MTSVRVIGVSAAVVRRSSCEAIRAGQEYRSLHCHDEAGVIFLVRIFDKRHEFGADMGCGNHIAIS